MPIPRLSRIAMLPLAACVLISSGCAAPSPGGPPALVTSPRLPPPDPRLMAPVDPESYSLRVQASLRRWAMTLEGSPP